MQTIVVSSGTVGSTTTSSVLVSDTATESPSGNAVTQQDVNRELTSNKLDKVTIGDKVQVYAVNSANEQDMLTVVSNSASANTLPERNANGTFAVGNATADNEPMAYGQGAKLYGDNIFTGNNTYSGNEVHNGNVAINGSLTLNGEVVGATQINETLNQVFSNSTFSGSINAIEMVVSDTCSIVSFWGNAQINAAGTSGKAFQILDPTTYPLLQRFVGQVDQAAIGIDAQTWADVRFMPVRITSASGVEIVTPPVAGVNTNFTWQFMLILTTGGN